MLAVESELESSLQELDDLQTRTTDYEEDMREARETMEELRKEVEEARAQSFAVVCSKGTAEHRLDMTNQEVQIQRCRIEKWKRITWK